MAGITNRIVFLTSSLGAGGAERVLAALADYLCDLGNDIAVVTIRSEEADFFRTSGCVDRAWLGFEGLRWFHLRRLWKLFRSLRTELVTRRPEVLVSFLIKPSILALLASRGLRIPTVVSEHSVIARKDISLRNVLLRRFLYPMAGRVVLLTTGIEAELNALVPRCRTSVIPNPLVPRKVPSTAFSPHSDDPQNLGRVGPLILAIGRLHPVKGFDFLLDAFAQLSAEVSSALLVILGEGDERPALEAQARRLGIADRVQFPGRKENIDAYLKVASVFVLSSRVEGFPVTLLEALSAGAPVVATRCSSGVTELIEDGVTGILVEPGSVSALASAMRRLLSDPTLARRLTRAGQDRSEKYSIDAVAQQWMELFREVAAT
jgi:glycosyltransferase involved in cell wall biosynthesis